MSKHHDVRQGFGRRLKAVRRALGRTQEGFARLLGIHPARYSKYEIGRSEAPYDVLIKISKLAGISLDYLIAGEETAPSAPELSPGERLIVALSHLPAAAAVFDRHDRLIGWNDAYSRTFFPEDPTVMRAGVTRDFLARAWAYTNGIDPLETEAFVRERRVQPQRSNTSVRVQLGEHPFHLLESQYSEYKLVVVAEAGDPQSVDLGTAFAGADDGSLELIEYHPSPDSTDAPAGQ